MIDRKHIEQFLSVNGMTPDSPDEEIRSLLISARWHHHDVETALVVLREDPKTRKQRIDTVHRVFNAEQRLNPETISSLLGMDVEVDSVVADHRKDLRRRYLSQIYSIVILSVVASFVFLFALMWFMQVGVFHEYAAGLRF